MLQAKQEIHLERVEEIIRPKSRLQIIVYGICNEKNLARELRKQK